MQRTLCQPSPFQSGARWVNEIPLVFVFQVIEYTIVENSACKFAPTVSLEPMVESGAYNMWAGGDRFKSD
jgi:hypothetical protein